MELLKDIIGFILHIDVHLNELILAYGVWTYAILFLIIFCETGLVVTPFLPGDSLLFAAGALSASGSMDPLWLFVLLSVAAIVGNIVNYSIGYYLGPRLLKDGKLRILNKAYLERTHKFYAEHGGKTIVIARFLPSSEPSPRLLRGSDSWPIPGSWSIMWRQGLHGWGSSFSGGTISAIFRQ